MYVVSVTLDLEDKLQASEEEKQALVAQVNNLLSQVADLTRQVWARKPPQPLSGYYVRRKAARSPLHSFCYICLTGFLPSWGVYERQVETLRGRPPSPRPKQGLSDAVTLDKALNAGK